MKFETYITGTGQKIAVHMKGTCKGNHCPIHNPSNHPLKDAPTHWRSDTRVMERICKHGCGHPDNDSDALDPVKGIHGCDGCCTGKNRR